MRYLEHSSFCILRITRGIFDFRFFAYYGLFVAGIVVRKYNLLYKVDVKRYHTGLAAPFYVILMGSSSFKPLDLNIVQVYDLLASGDAQTIFELFSARNIALYHHSTSLHLR